MKKFTAFEQPIPSLVNFEFISLDFTTIIIRYHSHTGALLTIKTYDGNYCINKWIKFIDLLTLIAGQQRQKSHEHDETGQKK